MVGPITAAGETATPGEVVVDHPKTTYKFVFKDQNVAFELEVPFSPDELELLKQACDLVHLLGREAFKAPGWQRKISEVLGVPWGGFLEDRKDSFQRIDQLRTFLQEITGPTYKDTDPTDIAQRPRDFSKKMFEILEKLPKR